jgi:hypothetical protein
MRTSLPSLLVLGALGLPLGAEATPPPDQSVQVGRLPCQAPFEGRTRGLRQLGWELAKRTSVHMELEAVLVDPAGEDLFRTPFLLWACDGPVAPLGEGARANLRRFLQLGGFLLADDPRAEPEGAFERSLRAELAAVLPDRPLEPLPRDHVLWKTFFLVEGPAGRARTGAPVRGVSLGGQLAVVFVPDDLLGALGRDLSGSWELTVSPGGEAQREQAMRLGINLVLYALCLDYKNDRVHLPFILKRRRQ